MILSKLVEKDGLQELMTETLATDATYPPHHEPTVASVATVTVATPQAPISDLSTEDENKLREWLAHVDEHDPDIIANVLASCRNNLDAREKFLDLAASVPKPSKALKGVCCRDCVHFKRINHPNLGHCDAGQPEALCGLWDTDHRHCSQFEALLEPGGNSS